MTQDYNTQQMVYNQALAQRLYPNHSAVDAYNLLLLYSIVTREHVIRAQAKLDSIDGRCRSTYSEVYKKMYELFLHTLGLSEERSAYFAAERAKKVVADKFSAKREEALNVLHEALVYVALFFGIAGPDPDPTN